MKKFLTATILAAFIAVGLTASASADHDKGHYDASWRTSDSVGSKKIKDNSIRQKDLRPKVRTKVKNGNKALRKVERNKARWSQDEVGMSGHGIGNRERRFTDTIASMTLKCGEGRVATGGGHEFSAFRDNPVPQLISSEPSLVDNGDGTFTADGWTVRAKVEGTANVKVWAVCADR